MILSEPIHIEEHRDLGGRNQYKAWFDSLDVATATRVAVALERIAQGHTSAIKSVGEGVSEYKLDFVPGYRIYFGKDGDRLVILLGGGTKKRQSQDIKEAQVRWSEYKRRKKAAQKLAAQEAATSLAKKATQKRRKQE
jgi:putative addiction module killer protein